MDETGAYTDAVLEPFKDRLENLKTIIKQDSEDGKHPEPIVLLMTKKLEGVGEQYLRASASAALTNLHRAAAQWSVRVPICALGRARPYTYPTGGTEEAAFDAGGRAKAQ